MKFKSIRIKLIQSVSVILLLSFVSVLSAVAYINIQDMKRNIELAKHDFRAELIAKGRILVSNNSQALKGMVDDNAFTAVHELVVSTVEQDVDIAYGIFMDSDSFPWVSTEFEDKNSLFTTMEPLTDKISEWVLSIDQVEHHIHFYKGIEVYEFAAPVLVDGEILGFIRYALSTNRVDSSIANFQQSANNHLMHTLSIVIAIGAMALLAGLLATRRMAVRITNPLANLTKAATTISSGDFTNEIRIESNDELSILASNFDVMRSTIEEHNRNLEEKVKERTAKLHEKNSDILNMLQNMRQGLFTITSDHTIHNEYSAFLEEIFEIKEIAGKRFIDLLFTQSSVGEDAINQIEGAMLSILHEDEDLFCFNSHLLLSEYVKFCPSGEKSLELAWVPIVINGVVDKVMVTVRDITLLKSLQAESEEQKKELEIIGQILSVDQERFIDFIHESTQFIEQCRSIIECTHDNEARSVEALFRYMHTIKGNARTNGFHYVTDSVHCAESYYDQLRKNPEMAWYQQKLIEDLTRAEEDLASYRHIAIEKLGFDLDTQATDRLKEEGDKLINLSNALSVVEPKDVINLSEPLRSYIASSYMALLSQGAVPLEQLVIDSSNAIESNVKQLEKELPAFKMSVDGVYIIEAYQRMLGSVLMHIFNNAIDHGIEASSERVANKKPSNGVIYIKTEVSLDKTLHLILSDDGRGLALKRLYESGLEAGLLSEQESVNLHQIAQLILCSGLSTAEQLTTLSGRGVGLNAVKQFIESMGGRLEIKVAQDAHQAADSVPEFAPFETHIYLPQTVYVQVPIYIQGSSQVSSAVA